MEKMIKEALEQSNQLKNELISQWNAIRQITLDMASSFSSNKKVLICGNGGSASDAQHFAAELVGRFKRERKGLPAIALTADTSVITAIANDYGFDKVFSRQVEALGEEGDVLVAISTSGNSENVINAVKEAKRKNIKTAGLLGSKGGRLGHLCDLSLIVSSSDTARVQESHILIIHLLCDIIEKGLHSAITK